VWSDLPSGWFNIDLFSASPQATAHDLRKGIPYPDCYFDVVYHSHVLKHMTNSQGKLFMTKTLRVWIAGPVLVKIDTTLEQHQLGRYYRQLG
jgi:predicted SAM-dependent methyltransferase